MKITKTDLAVIALLLLLAVFFMPGRGGGAKKLFLITDNGRTSVPLKKHLIKLKDGHVVIEITDKGARFIESDCPNKICIKSGWVTKCGGTAVCVPNRIALVMECREADYDAVSQ